MSASAFERLGPAFPQRAPWGTSAKLRAWQADALDRYLGLAVSQQAGEDLGMAIEQAEQEIKRTTARTADGAKSRVSGAQWLGLALGLAIGIAALALDLRLRARA